MREHLQKGINFMSNTVEITDEQINAIAELVGYCSDSSEFNCFVTCLMENVDLEKHDLTEEDALKWQDEDDIPEAVFEEAPNTVYKEAVIVQKFLSNINKEDIEE